MQTITRTQQRTFGPSSCLARPHCAGKRVARAVVKVSAQQGALDSSRREILLAGATAAVLPAFLVQQPARAEDGMHRTRPDLQWVQLWAPELVRLACAVSSRHGGDVGLTTHEINHLGFRLQDLLGHGHTTYQLWRLWWQCQ